MAEKSTVRQRKNAKKSKNGDSTTAVEAKGEATEPTSLGGNDNVSLSSTFFSHPLVRVAPFVLIPYLIFSGMKQLELKRPEWVNQATGGLAQFRPAVGTTEERQVLIIGASIGDNRMVSKELSKILKLEIAHETFDSQNEFCRDGSVSWYQILRFVGLADSIDGNGRKGTASSATKRLDAFKEMCIDRSSSIAKTFHPKLYAPSDCLSFGQWSNCWTRECLRTIKSLWECGTPENPTTSSKPDDDAGRCSPPFRRILHQTRYPLFTIENFNKTLCSSEKLQADFFKIVAGFFPHRDWKDMSCVEAVSWYTYDFESTLLKARKEDRLVDGMFAIETTSPCEVASMAGFMDDRSNAVDSSTVERLSTICHGPDDDDDKHFFYKNDAKKDPRASSQDVFVPRHSKNSSTEIKVSVTWEDMEKELGGNRNLVNLLKTLTEELGYGSRQRKGISEFS